ncbi:hypothetical protein FSP39_013569 [Pinctada imbricata]|uniref:Uncharacterized protein n=1 Tax=Pinctada imbricata TaxID=66713 RepID=A0AA88XWR9_PINIB|nr:hypothetical protein FSP39_013569 [Pinctada imbricata]
MVSVREFSDFLRESVTSFLEFQPTLPYQKIPRVLHEPSILAGYRQTNQPWRYYLTSLFQIHNETFNVWSHLIGFALVWILLAEYSENYDFWSDSHLWPMLAFGICSDRMREEDFGFGDKDVSNLDKVIDAVHELEEERRKIHEKLETETIHASILRHKLQFLPAQIKEEIKAAVNSARQSNANALTTLQSKLDGIYKNTSYLEDRQHDLDKENAKLHPERDLIREKHEEIITQLNERMAEKANMQIILNETRDKVRQTNQNIVDLEDGILQLKEDLILERTEARTEKKKLKKAVAETTDITKEQRESNIVKKKELDEFHEQLMDSEGKVEAVRKSLRRYETSKAKLEGQERQLAAQLIKQLKNNEELRRKGSSIINEDLKLQKEFEDNEKQLQKRLKRLETDIEKETNKNAELEGRKLELHVDLEDRQTVRESDAERVRDLDEELQLEKGMLARKAEEMGRMQSENVEMQEQIESLADSHKAVLAQLNKQIEGFREQLSKERKESEEGSETKSSSRPSSSVSSKPSVDTEVEFDPTVKAKPKGMSLFKKKPREPDPPSPEPVKSETPKPPSPLPEEEEGQEEEEEGLEVQERKNSVQKDVEDYKQETQRFLSEMNKKIKEGKAKHMELTNEGTQLQKQLKADEEEISELTNNLEEAQNSYTTMFTTMTNKIDTMKTEIVDMEQSIEEKKKQVEERTPIFEELEKVFEERTNAYNAQKKNIAMMRQKKSQLEDSIKKAKDEKVRASGPREALKKDLKKKRDESMFQLKRHGEDRKNVEQDIFTAACKLRSIMEENQKIENGCTGLEKELEDLRNQMEENERIKQKLENDLDGVKMNLVESWQKDMELNDFYVDKDQEVVDGYSDLLSKTEERETKINQITKRLDEELVYLSKFLENLATRRPQHTPPPERKKLASRDANRSHASSRMSQKSQKITESRLQTPRSPKSARPQTRSDVKSAKTVTICDTPAEMIKLED